MKEFFLGYLPTAPAGIRRRVRFLLTAFLLLGTAGALLFAASQRQFANSKFDYGKPAEFTGVVRLTPFPILVPQNSDGQPSLPAYLLCAPGKHGVDSLLQPLTSTLVTLRGTLIHREAGQMIEVIPGSVTSDHQLHFSDDFRKDLGERTLQGEIVDPKCFLGVMNPGEGKVHRECAALCLNGGIPPALFTRELDGTQKIILLTDPAGNPLPKSSYLQQVGQPVRVQGRVFEAGGLLYIHTSPGNITALP